MVASEPGAEETYQPRPQAPAAAIQAGPEGHLVWRTLKAAWLTHHFVDQRHTHVKGGYAWDASQYLPVLTLNDEGDPVLGFTRRLAD